MITMFSKPNCPHCDAAESWLKNYHIPYNKVNILADETALNFVKEQGHRTVPQLYVGKKLLVEGGNSGLRKMSPNMITEMLQNEGKQILNG